MKKNAHDGLRVVGAPSRKHVVAEAKSDVCTAWTREETTPITACARQCAPSQHPHAPLPDRPCTDGPPHGDCSHTQFFAQQTLSEIETVLLVVIPCLRECTRRNDWDGFGCGTKSRKNQYKPHGSVEYKRIHVALL